MRDFSIDQNWTARFTETFDKNYKFTDEESIAYLNSGTGNHVLALRDRLDNDIEILGVTENEDLSAIATAKSKAIKANVEFSTLMPPEHFDLVILDSSLVRSREAIQMINNVAATAENRVVFFLPTAGSFGEIFSILWEAFLNSDLAEHGSEIERLIKEIPTVSDIESAAKTAGLKKLQVKTSIEIFEYARSEEFINSTLINDFLMPGWLDFLTENEYSNVLKSMAKTIDENRDEMSFWFSVKATMLGGQRI